MVQFGNGFTIMDLYKMPTHLRNFYYNKLVEAKKKESEAVKGAKLRLILRQVVSVHNARPAFFNSQQKHLIAAAFGDYRPRITKRNEELEDFFAKLDPKFK